MLAKEHPEIFRVSEEGGHPLSLVARHVQPRDQDGKQGPLSQEFTNVLIKTAIDLHDRQVDAASWWKHMMPLWTALIAAFVVIASSLLTLRFSHSSASGRFVRVGEPYPDSVLLDTATGRYCYSDILGQKNSFNFPTCREPR